MVPDWIPFTCLFLAALATLPLGIVGLLSNFSLVGVFVTGAP